MWKAALLAPYPRARFGGRTASSAERLDWVAKSLGCTDADPDECPDAAAWALMLWCREDSENKKVFWTVMLRSGASKAKAVVQEPDEAPDDSALELMKELVGES